MEQQPPRRSLLILLAVALIVIGVLVVKALPKQERVTTRPTPVDHPVRQSVAAVPKDSTRYGSGGEALSDEARAAQQEQSVETTAPPVERASAPSDAEELPIIAAPADTPVKDMQTAPEPPNSEGVVEPLSGSELGEALANGKPTMVDFGAGWCQACKMMEPVLKESAKKHLGTADVVYVDTDKFPQLARDHKITAIPTQIFFDASGKEVNRHMGYWPIEEVDKQLAALGVGE